MTANRDFPVVIPTTLSGGRARFAVGFPRSLRGFIQAFAIAAFLAQGPAYGQSQNRIVIDGTDANEHGSVSGSVNQAGWRYMQKVFEAIAPQVLTGNKTFVALGSDASTQARNAIDSAFNLSNLPAAGWNLVHINGSAEINTFFSGGVVAGITKDSTGILHLTTSGSTSGDLNAQEMAAINNNASALADIVNRGGAGLFAMAESEQRPAGWGWLTTLINTVTPVEGSDTGLTLTSDGQAAFPGLTNADLSTGPWHNYFTGDFGALKVLAVGSSNRAVILGGLAVAGSSFQFSAAAYSADENGGTATLTVTRSGITTSAETVQYFVSGGSASRDVDYTLADGVVNFAGGETQKTVSIPLIDDVLDEEDETITVTLRNPSVGSALGNVRAATLTIVDNDPLPSVTIEDITVLEGLSATSNAVFAVRLSVPSGRAVTVNFVTANQGATALNDFIAQSGTLAFNPGDTSKTISVAVNGDMLPEPTETFTVHLIDPINVTIARAQGTGTIINAPLNLALTLENPTVLEGGSLDGTVSLETALSQPVDVALTSSSATRLSFPEMVTIPAGQTSATFATQSVQNQAIELPVSVALSASAEGFNSTNVSLQIRDDDQPTILLTIDHAMVSERDGSSALSGTITLDRTLPFPSKLVLGAEPPGNVILPAFVAIPANSLSARFPIGVVNNQAFDGEREVTLVAFLLDTAGSNPVGQSPPVMLTVTDDEGSSLAIAVDRTLLIEGNDPAATATVIRQPVTESALVVTLVSSDTTEMTAPASVTIPAGQAAASFPLRSIADGQPDGNQSVALEVSAPGFSPASKNLTVTDLEKPDLFVDLVAPPTGGETEAWIDVRILLRNQGARDAQGPFTQRIYLSSDALPGGDILLTQADFSGLLPPGSFIEQSLRVRLPRTGGRYWLIAETDANRALDEALEDNNVAIAATPIDIEPAYSTTLSIAPATVPSGAPIPITGSATLRSGGPAAYALVNIHITNGGIHRVISALTNANGLFDTTFTPLPGEGGLFQFGAAHPGLEVAPVQDEVRVYALRAEPAAVTLMLTENAPQTGQLLLLNLADLPISGLAVATTGLPAGVQFMAALSATNVAPSGSVSLDYSISAPALLGEKTFALTVSSAEGATVTVPITVSVASNQPVLIAEPNELLAGMLRGQQQFINFNLRNAGRAATGPITILLPSGAPWMRLVTPLPLPALAPGESVPVTLQLLPPADLSLEEFSGRLVATDGLNTVPIPFKIRALSDQTGNLVVRAEDEYTYYAQGNPPLAGASVIVTDALTRQPVATLVTDASGSADFGPLREGYYEIEVTAHQHTTFRTTHLVIPGAPNQVRAFLSRQTVSYHWTVVPTQIEDRYKVTIDTTFETNVPLPVLTMTPTVIDLADITVDETIVNVTVTNQGLLAANAVQLNYPSHPKWEFTPLVKNLGLLPAKSSITVPVKIRRLTVGGQLARTSSDAATTGEGPCTTGASACAVIPCGDLLIPICANQALTNADTGCPAPQPTDAPYCPDCPPITPGGVNPSSSGGSVKLVCDAGCLEGAALSCIPGSVGCSFGLAGCVDGLYDDDKDILDFLDCPAAVLGCAPLPQTKVPLCLFGIFRCFIKIELDQAWASDLIATGQPRYRLNASLALPSMARPHGFDAEALAPYRAGIRGYLDAFNEITGSPDGVWINDASDLNLRNWFAGFHSTTNPSSADGRKISTDERSSLLSAPLPEAVPAAEITRLLERWNRTIDNWSSGILVPSNAPPGTNLDFMDAGVYRAALLKLKVSVDHAQQNGFPDPFSAVIGTVHQLANSGEGDGVCGRIKLQLEQDAVLTRDAFRATLEVENSGASSLENVRVDLTLRDSTGLIVPGVFAVRYEGASGLSAVDGTGSLAGASGGSARWQIIPTVDAAPAEPTQYFVGGRLTYTTDGVEVSVPFAEVPITVLPSPRLILKYFHQRDVFSDDPFTNVDEPAIPYSLAVMVENRGFGVARDFRITSAQPEIIENEKGLLADFKIIATQVEGQPLQPSLTATFGDIGAGQIKIGEWLMTSSIHGLFIDYSATVEHLDGGGNRRLSLIDSVEIYEMNHLVRALGPLDDGKPDFLVNEVADARDLPDTLFLSDGTTAPVAVVEQAQIAGQIAPGQFTLQFTTAPPTGWNYLRIPEPTNAQYALTRVVRSDGLEIPIDVNVWVTDRTFLGQGRRPTYENILHLLDHGGPGSYTLTYALQVGADTITPSSRVLPLAAQSAREFAVSWEGADDRRVAYFDLYVSVDGGPFQLWLQRTREPGAIYAGELGRSYAFYSRATDAAGNREAAPSSADATTSATLQNIAPILTAIPNQELNEGELLALDLLANDPDGRNDLLRFGFVSAGPPGLTINAQTGQVRWLTGEADGGSEVAVWVWVMDAGVPVQSALQPFTIRVLEQNQAPRMADIAPQRIAPGQQLVLQLHAEDADLPQQTIRYRFTGAATPATMAIDAATGLITWQPEMAEADQTVAITVTATDSGSPPLETTKTFSITVDPANQDRPPQFRRNAPELWLIGTTRTLEVSAFDPDGDTVTMTLAGTGLPSGLSFNSVPGTGRGLLLWNTSGNQPGIYSLPLKATAGLAEAQYSPQIKLVPDDAYWRWAVAHLSNLTDLSLADPPADPDGDGEDNLSEFRSNTNPTDSDSLLRSARILNIGTRLRVLADDNVLIGGFIITGSESKKFLIRGIGPSLADGGIPGALEDPALKLFDETGTIIGFNNDWRDTQQAEIEATTMPPSNERESALVQVLAPGNYTTIVSGNDGGTGIGLVEIYDLASSQPARLANIATRGFIDSGDNVMIGGFIVGAGLGTDNSGTATLLLRAIGPSLREARLANPLEDPTLELVNENGTVIRANNNWKDTQQPEIEATTIPPLNDLESALIQTVPAGFYTVIMRGVDNTTGVGLIEVYRLQ